MKFHRVKQITATMAICVLLASGIRPSWAQIAPAAGEFLEITPALIQIEKQAGERFSQKVVLKNRSEEPLAVKVYLSPLTRGSAANFQNLIGWVSFEDDNSSFLLPPFSQKELIVKIQVPETAQAGGYYGQIMFEPLMRVKSRSPLQVVPVMAMPLLVEVKSSDQKMAPSLVLEKMDLAGKIESQILIAVINKVFRVSTAYAASSLGAIEEPLRFQTTLKNTGKFLTRASGALNVFNFRGEKLASGSFREVSLLPEESKTLFIETPWQEKSWFWLIFPRRLKAVIEVGGGQSELIFWVFSWKKTLTVVLFVLCLIVLFHWRARFLAALTALLRA